MILESGFSEFTYFCCKTLFSFEAAWTFHGGMCPPTCTKSLLQVVPFANPFQKCVDGFFKRQQTANKVYQLFWNDPSTPNCVAFWTLTIAVSPAVFPPRSDVLRKRAARSLHCSKKKRRPENKIIQNKNTPSGSAASLGGETCHAGFTRSAFNAPTAASPNYNRVCPAENDSRYFWVPPRMYFHRCAALPFF